MSVNVYIPTPWRRLTAGAAHVTVEGAATLAELVDRLEISHTGLKGEIWEGEDLKRHVNVYVNGEEARGLKGTATPLKDGDEIAFVPMLAGGAPLVVTREAWDGMVNQARAEYPNECCGMLAGKDGVATVARPMANAEASPVVYRMDPKEQLAFYEWLDEQGMDEIGAYHSHTRSPAYPSPTDVRLAHAFVTYVIVSLQDQANPSVRAFHIEDGQIAELGVDVR